MDGVTGAKLEIAGEYKVAASQKIEISGPLSITLKCGPTSSVEIGPEMVTVKVGAATLVVTPAGIVMSPSAAVGQRPL